MILIVLISLIILEAVHEGLYDRGLKRWSDLPESLFLIVIIYGVVFIQAEWIWILIYILYRYSFFDAIYNLCAGNNILYTGETKFYGRTLNAIFNKIGKMFPKPHVLFITKLMSLTTAVGLTWWFWPF